MAWMGKTAVPSSSVILGQFVNLAVQIPGSHYLSQQVKLKWSENICVSAQHSPTTGSSLHHREWKHLVVMIQVCQCQGRASQHYKGELAENTEMSPLGKESENHL